jgi:hypothetical protein
VFDAVPCRIAEFLDVGRVRSECWSPTTTGIAATAGLAAAKALHGYSSARARADSDWSYVLDLRRSAATQTDPGFRLVDHTAAIRQRPDEYERRVVGFLDAALLDGASR